MNIHLYQFSWLFLYLLNAIQASTEDEEHSPEWFKLTSSLPIKMSDMSASYIPYNKHNHLSYDYILIAGGCISQNGNAYSEFKLEGELVGGYYCSEITDQVFAFHVGTAETVSLPNMLSKRYRHGAVVLENRLYVVGGRTQVGDDTQSHMATTIDVSFVHGHG